MTLEKHMLFQLPVCLGPAGPGQESTSCANREEGNAHKMDRIWSQNCNIGGNWRGYLISHWGRSIYVYIKKIPMAVTGLKDCSGKHQEHSSYISHLNPTERLFFWSFLVWAKPSPQRSLRNRVSLCCLHNITTCAVCRTVDVHGITQGKVLRSSTHPKKSAWSAVPYREGDSSSSGYSVSLVLSVPRPMAAITKSTGRMTWAMKPRTSRRVWWDLLMNRAEILFSSSGKPRRLLDLISSWSGHTGQRGLVMAQHLCWALWEGIWLPAHFYRWQIHTTKVEKTQDLVWDRTPVTSSCNTSILLNLKCLHEVTFSVRPCKMNIILISRWNKLSTSYLPSCNLQREHFSFRFASWNISSFKKQVPRKINNKINPEIGKHAQGTGPLAWTGFVGY